MAEKKIFKPTPGMIAAAENLFLALAIEQTIRPVVEGYQRQILSDGQWHINAKYVGQRGTVDRIILDPKESWLMADGDFVTYEQRCRLARDAARLSVELDEHCPLLIVEDTVRLAKRAMIDAMEETTGITADKLLCAGMAKYNQYVDLTMKLLATFVDKQQILTGASAQIGV